MRCWTAAALGWDLGFERERGHAAPNTKIGRVAIEYGGVYRVFVPADEVPAPAHRGVSEVNATLPGKWRHANPLDVPAVGDWVALRESGDGFAVDYRFERRAQFLRQAAGRRSAPQVVGANVDVVFVVTSLDHDFNPRRIERYLAAVLDGGARPVVVLSKADLHEAPETARAALGPVAANVPIELVSAERGVGLDRIFAHLGPGRTGALTGSSGVGKSTLVNRLVGQDVQRTNEVRAADGKGRHTTTHRELILLGPERGILVDTPGMRELQLWTPGDGVAQAFEDIEALAESCRFRDCRHEGEPGCAVEAAIASGELPAERKASFLKLRREDAHHERRAEPWKQREAGRKMSAVVKDAKASRRRRRGR